jgi:glycosyl transferase family 25
MRAYIISLHNPNNESNYRLSSLLKRNGYTVCFVKAICGSDLDAHIYYSKVQSYFELTDRLLCPAELGCALSHGEAYNALLLSKEQRALILEDDAILDDEGCDKLSLLLSLNIEHDSFIHLGGQEGLKSSFEHVHGILRYDDPRVFEIASDDLRHVHRCVGYIVSSRAAKHLARALSEKPFLIDDFKHFVNVSQLKNFYFTKIVRHPSDLSKSAIQGERELSARRSGKSLFSRLMSEVDKTVIYRRPKIFSYLKYRRYTLLMDELYGRED